MRVFGGAHGRVPVDGTVRTPLSVPPHAGPAEAVVTLLRIPLSLLLARVPATGAEERQAELQDGWRTKDFKVVF